MPQKWSCGIVKKWNNGVWEKGVMEKWNNGVVE
jgi:hypothetical protein